MPAAPPRRDDAGRLLAAPPGSGTAVIAVAAVVFDLNGTLTDPAALGAPWEAPELGPEVLSGAIQSAMAETLFGAYHEFREHLESALRAEVARRRLDERRIDEALARARRLPPFPDVRPALERLRASALRLAVLTNSGAAAGRQTLEAAGLDGYFEAILGVDAVRMFKPHPDTYGHALHALGSPEPATVLMVAVHAWDLAGAKHAGLQTALVRRGGEPVPAVFPEPDLVVDSMAGLAGQLAPSAG
jgi:2-haloacid dehalogenase